MKVVLLLIPVLLLFGNNISAQNDFLKDYNHKMYGYNKKGWWTVSSWAMGNVALGTAGIITAEDDQTKSFHQMNIMSNVVNIGFAVPGLIYAYKRQKQSFGVNETFQNQLRQEKVYLFNAGLDLFYVGAGIALLESSKNSLNYSATLRGFGNSVILQGGFLFIVDASMTLIHNRHRKKYLDPKLEMAAGENGIGLKLKL